MKPIRITPKITSWIDSAWRSISERSPKTIAPATAPRTEPMPPTTTIVNTTMVVWKPRLSGWMKDVNSVYMPPAMPANAADMAKAHAVNHPAPYAIQNIT